MNKIRFLLLSVCGLLISATNSPAQSLPAVTLKPAYTQLKDERPVWMSEAPDGSGRLFFVYQDGKIVIVKKGSDGSDAKEFFNIVDRNPHFENEDGLMSIAFHPGFATNGLFYVYYNQKNPKDQHLQPQNYPFRSVISEFKVSATNADMADMKSERILLEVPQPFSNHKGGELAFGPDGYLYLGLGDGGAGNDPFGSGQSTATLLAKILRLDVNSRATVGNGAHKHELPYGFPKDNPFVHESEMGGFGGAHKEIFAYGLRNPWRYSFDRTTGALWVGDVGQDLWEEVDVVTNGANCGWSVREGTHSFKPGPAGAQYTEPVIEYSHRANLQAQGMFPDHPTGNCVIGGYVYRGKQFPALDGVYLYADYSPATIYGLRYDAATQKATEHGKLFRNTDSLTSFAEDGDGELYALMQSGKIYQIVAQ